jgi:hypothetical protein
MIDCFFGYRFSFFRFPSGWLVNSVLSIAIANAGLYVKAGATKYPNLCFYRNVQTVTYAIVDGSYVPTTTQTHQPDKTKVPLFCILFFSPLLQPMYFLRYVCLINCCYESVILGKWINKTWKCWCISKATNGDAIGWYTLFSIEEGQESATHKRWFTWQFFSYVIIETLWINGYF